MTKREAIEVLQSNYPDRCFETIRDAVDLALEALSTQEWVPVKWEPLNDIEREELEDAMGYRVADEEAVKADCKMPRDGDEIWICTKSGVVFEDVFCSEYGMCSLIDGDIMDIVAWMPRKAPEPYKEER